MRQYISIELCKSGAAELSESAGRGRGEIPVWLERKFGCKISMDSKLYD